jgi:hypothetical protein
MLAEDQLPGCRDYVACGKDGPKIEGSHGAVQAPARAQNRCWSVLCNVKFIRQSADYGPANIFLTEKKIGSLTISTLPVELTPSPTNSALKFNTMGIGIQSFLFPFNSRLT